MGEQLTPEQPQISESTYQYDREIPNFKFKTPEEFGKDVISRLEGVVLTDKESKISSLNVKQDFQKFTRKLDGSELNIDTVPTKDEFDRFPVAKQVMFSLLAHITEARKNIHQYQKGEVSADKLDNVFIRFIQDQEKERYIVSELTMPDFENGMRKRLGQSDPMIEKKDLAHILALLGVDYSKMLYGDTDINVYLTGIKYVECQIARDEIDLKISGSSKPKPPQNKGLLGRLLKK